MDKNFVVLQGRIGSVLKEGKAQNGNTFMYFGLDVEAKSNSYSTENNQKQVIKVMLFRPKVIGYLKKMKVRSGTPVVVFGFVSSFLDEVGGKQILTNALNAHEVLCIQTRPYND